MSVRKNVLNIACSLSLSPIKVDEHVIGDKSNPPSSRILQSNIYVMYMWAWWGRIFV